MKQISLEYSYKGNRNYVHGTDIYKQIVKNLDALGYDNWKYFELNIKKISQCNMLCFLSDKRYKHKEEIINFVLMKGSEQIFGSIIEDINSKVCSKYSFDENNITNQCIIDYTQEKITYYNPQNTFTTIDIVISVSKLYLENAVDNSGKWFLRTIKFLRPIDKIEIKKIWMKKIVQKMNIVKMDVYIEDELIGQAIGASIS